jgi:predicted transcriptional regulator
MATLTIRLNKKLDTALARMARRSGRSKCAVVRDLLQRQFAVLRFRELRAKVLPFAREQGLLRDEDVFRVVS